MNTSGAIRTLFSILILLFTFKASAQILSSTRYTNDTRVDFGLSMGLPTLYTFKSVVDADIRVQKDFTSGIAGFATAGFSYYLQDDIPPLNELSGNTVFVPVRTGVKAFLNDKVYISAGVGTALKATSGFSASLLHFEGLGMEISKAIDLGIRYESITRYQAGKIAITATYAFSLKKDPEYTSWYR